MSYTSFFLLFAQRLCNILSARLCEHRGNISDSPLTWDYEKGCTSFFSSLKSGFCPELQSPKIWHSVTVAANKGWAPNIHRWERDQAYQLTLHIINSIGFHKMEVSSFLSLSCGRSTVGLAWLLHGFSHPRSTLLSTWFPPHSSRWLPPHSSRWGKGKK